VTPQISLPLKLELLTHLQDRKRPNGALTKKYGHAFHLAWRDVHSMTMAAREIATEQRLQRAKVLNFQG